MDDARTFPWDVFAKLLALSDAGETVELVGEWLIFRKGQRRFDINPRTGEFWFSDEAKLWKPDFTQSPPAEDAAAPATGPNAVLGAWGGKVFSAPSSGIKMRVMVGAPRATKAARVTLVDGCSKDPKEWIYSARQKRIIDRHVPIGSEFEVPEPDTTSSESYRWAPLAGARLRWGVTYAAASDEIIGFHGALSSASAPPTWYPAIDEQASSEEFRKLFLADVGLIEYPRPTLAFEIWESAGDGGTWLIPVWQHRAIVRLDDDRPLALPVVSLTAVREFVPPPRFAAPDFDASSVDADCAMFKTGAWWIDSDDPLKQLSTKKNANDFVRGMAAAKWGITKIAGNDDALVEDWRTCWATGVGQTDFAYYAGHAHNIGWHFNKNLSTTYRLSSTDVGARDTLAQLYGGRLKWIGLCACGPLGDDEYGLPDDDAFRRWAPAFDGLHTMLGYSSDIGARHESGHRLATYLQTHTVIDAWLRTARVQEVGAARAAVLYAFMSASPGSDPLMDRVGPTPSIAQMPSGRPDTFTAIWVPA